jgi:O-antigen/teichoic acid export membrane protein
MKAFFSNKIIKNIFWGAGGNAIMAAVSLVASVFVVRNLEPAEYGRLQEMIAYFLIFQNY